MEFLQKVQHRGNAEEASAQALACNGGKCGACCNRM